MDPARARKRKESKVYLHTNNLLEGLEERDERKKIRRWGKLRGAEEKNREADIFLTSDQER